jgi:hypothetical protein
VYLVSSPEAVAATGASFVFSDGNCAATVTHFDSDLIVGDVAWPSSWFTIESRSSASVPSWFAVTQ